MSSPCLSGGGRTYGFDLEIVKSPASASASASTSTRTNSHTSSSPSSTLSESSNSPLAISTRKPRTPRKRPNQTYNEAAALLSTAYPNIFSATTHLSNPRKFTKLPHHDESSSELLWPFRVFDDSGFPLYRAQKPSFLNEIKVSNLMSSCDKSESRGNSMELCDGYEEDFDAESILDEEIEEGIDSIMGNLSVSTENGDGDGNCWYGNPMGFHFGGKLKGVRALKRGDEGNWWSFPIVDMLQISPRLSSNNKVSDSNSNPKIKQKTTTTTKKKNRVQLKNLESTKQENLNLNSNSNSYSGLLLKLNYDEVLNTWSDRGSPFTDEISGSEPGNDVSARLAQIDLFSESGGVREASMLRYKEKRRNRLFSKKIRYQVRKVNADQRPRMKGRFVRRPNSSATTQRGGE